MRRQETGPLVEEMLVGLQFDYSFLDWVGANTIPSGDDWVKGTHKLAITYGKQLRDTEREWDKDGFLDWARNVSGLAVSNLAVVRLSVHNP